MEGTSDQGDATARSNQSPRDAIVSTLVVRPFIHHGRFKRFLAALEQRPGVLAVQPGRVRAGAVWLTVQHTAGIAMLPLLQSLTEFGPRVESGAGGKWLVQLADAEDEM
jgi:hypothetical protein